MLTEIGWHRYSAACSANYGQGTAWSLGVLPMPVRAVQTNKDALAPAVLKQWWGARDRGVGFDPAHNDEIFERFTRLGNVTNHSRGDGPGPVHLPTR